MQRDIFQGDFRSKSSQGALEHVADGCNYVGLFGDALDEIPVRKRTRENRRVHSAREGLAVDNEDITGNDGARPGRSATSCSCLSHIGERAHRSSTAILCTNPGISETCVVRNPLLLEVEHGVSCAGK